MRSRLCAFLALVGTCALPQRAGDAALALPEPLPFASAAAGRIELRGGAELRALAHGALERILATRLGARVRERLESGDLDTPVTIELNRLGDDFTRYRVPGAEIGESIAFDPERLPLVDTELGRLPATPETVLAHELGHAVLKLRREDEVIREVENPLRAELGLPLRVRF